MKRLIGFLLITAVAVLIAAMLQMPFANLGNIVIVAPPYRVDTSVQTALIAVIIFLIGLYLLARLLVAILGIPQRVRLFRRKRLQDRRLRTLSGLITDFLEGRFARVIKASGQLQAQADLQKDAPRALSASMAIAASAAHQLRDPALRDDLLVRLKEVETNVLRQDPLIAPLLEAQFAVDERKGAKALSALSPLTRGDRRHVHTLRLALKANQLQENWEEVLRISKLLENRKAIHEVAAARYKEQVARAWLAADRHRDARLMLESAINQQWDSGLCMLYAQCDDRPKEQLSQLEAWLQHHPLDPELNWALGRLCQRQQLWGKARMHLEASLRQKPMAQTHRALAEIAESLGEKETAAIHWKAAAQL